MMYLRKMNVFQWIESELNPERCDSTRFIYDHMESQSGRILPLIYRPFDPADRMHWCDRGYYLDFVSTAGTGRLLDFGPGDGWPSLIVAPLVREVIGVDASRRRVEVCRENALRMGLQNAAFFHTPADGPLPFAEASFDGIMAASSIEQTPDPKAMLSELHRVLRPGGCLRIHYEALERYRHGREQEICLWPVDDKTCFLIFYNRLIDEEFVDQYALTLSIPVESIKQPWKSGIVAESLPDHPAGDLRQMKHLITCARVCRTCHPGVDTMKKWLSEAGFTDVLVSRSGGEIAGKVFDGLDEANRPSNIDDIDKLLRPLVETAVRHTAKPGLQPALSARK